MTKASGAATGRKVLQDGTEFRTRKPNAAHQAIAELERCGYVSCVITQNVDNLHKAAGSQNVIDLHGVLQRIRCLDCDATDSRYTYQSRLQDCNPEWSASITAFAPDGDARISVDDLRSFDVPGCLNCGGIIKPDVVFFGEPVPELRSRTARRFLEQSDALIVVGSSPDGFFRLSFCTHCK